jgi:hypothetical protein
MLKILILYADLDYNKSRPMQTHTYCRIWTDQDSFGDTLSILAEV